MKVPLRDRRIVVCALRPSLHYPDCVRSACTCSFSVLGAILPGALLTGVLVWRALAANRAISERRLIESARVDAAALDREFAGTIGTLQVLATSFALEDEDLKGFHEESLRVMSTQPGWYSILLVSPEGEPLVSTRQPWGSRPPPVADPDSLHRLVATHQPAVGVIRAAPQDGVGPGVCDPGAGLAAEAGQVRADGRRQR